MLTLNGEGALRPHNSLRSETAVLTRRGGLDVQHSPEAASSTPSQKIGSLSGGLALIGAAVFGYTLETPFPGLAALPPCLGTAAVILSCERPGSNAAARLLSLPPAAALRRIPYCSACGIGR